MSVPASSPVRALIVKSSDTKLSHPAALESVYVAVLLSEVYVMPSIQVYESHAIWISVEELLLFTIRFKVTIESHPLAAPPKIEATGG